MRSFMMGCALIGMWLFPVPAFAQTSLKGSASSDEAAKQDLRAATSVAPAADADLARLLKTKLLPGSYIRVLDPNGMHQGVLVEITERGIDMNEQTGAASVPLTIPLTGVESTWRRKSNTGPGILVGAAAGIVIGMMVGAAVDDPDEYFEDKGLNMLGGAVVGGAVLGVVGAVIGSQTHSYTLVYERP
jgi:hypothetical protein